jgi:hypothetical protein
MECDEDEPLIGMREVFVSNRTVVRRLFLSMTKNRSSHWPCDPISISTCSTPQQIHVYL